MAVNSSTDNTYFQRISTGLVLARHTHRHGAGTGEVLKLDLDGTALQSDVLVELANPDCLILPEAA